MKIDDSKTIIQFIKELSETDKEIQEQEKEFMERYDCSRATFYRYRKKLDLRNKYHHHRKNKPKSVMPFCYFCPNSAQIIHHINLNRKDNSNRNLLFLCNRCHNKIHRIYNQLDFRLTLD